MRKQAAIKDFVKGIASKLKGAKAGAKSMSKLPDSGSKAVRKGGAGFGIPTKGSARRAGDSQLGRRQPKKTPWNPHASVERKGGAGFGIPTEGSARRAGDDAFTRPVKKKTYWKSNS